MTIQNLLQQPLAEIQRIVEAGQASNQVSEISTKFKNALLQELKSRKEAMQSESDTNEDDLLMDVPSFNDEGPSLMNGSFVRYRCMVQDNGLSLQLFSVKVDACHKTTGETRTFYSLYNDGFSLLDDNWEPMQNSYDEQFFSQKTPLFCVETPTEGKWVKAQRNSESNMNDVTAAVANLSLKGPSELVQKKIPPHFSPLSGHRTSVAIVKLYDEDVDVKLNEVIEFFGVLQHPEQQDNEDMSGYQFEDDVSQFRDVPVIHAVFFKRTPEHGHIGLKHDFEPNDYETLREKTLYYLTQHFLGDKILAEYTLATLVSKIHGHRNDLPIGYMPLNIYNLPTEGAFAKKTYDMLENVVPRSSYIPMSLEALNKGRFAPRFSLEESDGPSIGLISGALQVPSQTLFVIDETAMVPGKLDEKGVRNFHHLKHLLNNSSVNYDFGGLNSQEREFPLDCNAIVLSHGRCLFGLDFAIPMIPATTEMRTCDEESIPLIRAFLVSAKSREYSIPDELNEIINHDYAAGRQHDFQTGQKRHNPESLMMKLELARSLTLLSGGHQLTAEIWSRVTQMEECRFSRLQMINPIAQKAQPGR